MMGRGLRYLIRTVVQMFFLPWKKSLDMIAWKASLVLKFLSYFGVTPYGFLPESKLKELTSVLKHMHEREDVYRRALKELHEQLDTKDMDRRKALKRLKSTKDEMEDLEERFDKLQQEALRHGNILDSQGSALGYFASPAALRGPFVTHVTFLVLAAVVWWFSTSEHPSIQWKLVFAMFFPLLWGYSSWLMDRRMNELYRAPVILLCATWALIGFTLALCYVPIHAL